MQNRMNTFMEVINPVSEGENQTGTHQHNLKQCVEYALANYFAHLEDQIPSNLYELVLAEIELPLLEVVLRKTRGNQTKAAKMLGLSRGTLRKKLKQYGLDE